MWPGRTGGRGDHMNKASSLARRALDAYSAEYGDAGLPIDPVSVARSLGINVYSAKLENSLSGMIAKMSSDGDVNIFFNSEHAPVRQRFTVAHELGHYFAIQEEPNPKEAYIHKRDGVSACGTSSEEIFANQFAAELLMPQEHVSRLFNLGLDRIGLAQRFHVSLDAISHRLKNLRLA